MTDKFFGGGYVKIDEPKRSHHAKAKITTTAKKGDKVTWVKAPKAKNKTVNVFKAKAKSTKEVVAEKGVKKPVKKAVKKASVKPANMLVQHHPLPTSDIFGDHVENPEPESFGHAHTTLNLNDAYLHTCILDAAHPNAGDVSVSIAQNKKSFWKRLLGR